ncbi:cytochrome P450 81D11-like [Chenopodium quinoa]|uniref:cytochrome P450 81D11-like n=1 Tax=Chenopodium quinoa TaxID=63459 RepID=UPI000B77EA84|nr:cytochrome P450 81D11-like [Chenopodium quinoa]
MLRIFNFLKKILFYFYFLNCHKPTCLTCIVIIFDQYIRPRNFYLLPYIVTIYPFDYKYSHLLSNLTIPLSQTTIFIQQKSMEMEKMYLYPSLFAIIIFLYKILWPSKEKDKNLPPSPPSSPIWGHLHLLKPPFHKILLTLSERYGPIFSLRLGFQPLLVVSSLSAVEECLNRNDIVFADRPKFIVGEVLGYNSSILIWSPYGDHWRNLRRIGVLTMFSVRKLNEASPTRKAEIHNMILDLLTESEGGTQKVNLNKIFNKVAHNFVMWVVNGKPWDNMDLTPPSSMTMCDFFPILRWVGFGGIEKNLKKLWKKRDEYLQNLLDECRESIRRGSSCGEEVVTKNLIEQLLDLQEAEPDCYTDEFIKSFILMQLLSGSETTIQTLEWAMSNLINNPKIIAKAREEIDLIVGKGRLVNESDVPKLSYIRWIMYETLRLFPPAPLLFPHYSSKDCTIGGFHVKKGTMLYVNAWAIQRDPSLWDEPNVFKPERFAYEIEGYKFLPFGIGRRSCPGSAFAIRNITLTLATLIQCFDWEAPKDGLVDLTVKSGVNIGPKEKPLEAICHLRYSIVDVVAKLKVN